MVSKYHIASLLLAAGLLTVTVQATADDRKLISEINPGNATIGQDKNFGYHPEIVQLLRQRSYERAMPALKSLAEHGDTWAMREIGWLYARGNGVAANPAKAIDWFFKSASAGDARSMLLLGTCYARGIGVEKNSAEALHWLERARASGDRRVAGSAADEIRRL